jgi:tRNA threonylcarbamoyladenosine biosynthesis protein TsaE
MTTRAGRKESFVTRSEEETFNLAKSLARAFKGNEVVFLTGDLGAGKTVMAKGIAAALGLKDTGRVCSPTFTLLNIYQAKYTIYHIDLYRLEKRDEILDLGWEDWLGEGIVIVEWAEKVGFDPGCPVIWITIRFGEGDERHVYIQSWESFNTQERLF